MCFEQDDLSDQFYRMPLAGIELNSPLIPNEVVAVRLSASPEARADLAFLFSHAKNAAPSIDRLPHSPWAVGGRLSRGLLAVRRQ